MQRCQELDALYDQLHREKETFFQGKDELVGKLYGKEHKIRELDFQMNLQRQELQLEIDLKAKESMQVKAENLQLAAEVERLQRLTTEL